MTDADSMTDLRVALTEAIGNDMGWEESAVHMVDNVVLPVIRQHYASPDLVERVAEAVCPIVKPWMDSRDIKAHPCKKCQKTISPDAEEEGTPVCKLVMRNVAKAAIVAYGAVASDIGEALEEAKEKGVQVSPAPAKILTEEEIAHCTVLMGHAGSMGDVRKDASDAPPPEGQGSSAPTPSLTNPDTTAYGLWEMLLDLYSPLEAAEWLRSNQSLLDNYTPLQMMMRGRGDEVIVVLKRVLEGAYI